MEIDKQFTDEFIQAFTENGFYAAPNRTKIHVKLDGKDFKIRLLLIDTPETAKEGKAAQPFADQAKQKTEELLKKAKKVEGKFDVGDYTDKYGRALMYVYLDGKLLQQTLVEESLARVGYAHPPNTTLLKDLQKVEEQTKKKKKNIVQKVENQLSVFAYL